MRRSFVMFVICGPAGLAGGPALIAACTVCWTSSSSCAGVIVTRLKLFVAGVSGGAMLLSGVGGGGSNDGGLANEAKNSVAWLLCLLELGSTAEVAPPSGSGVLSLAAKVSILLLAAWLRARHSLRLWSASRS